MMDSTTTSEVLDFAEGEQPKLSSGLNVLTILTFIGCALSLILSVYSFMTVEASYKKMQDMQEKLADLPPLARKMMGPEALEMSRKSMENRTPILLITLVGVALCLYGAIEMRKLKKQGYILWLAGEVLPIIGGGIIMGIGMFSGFYLIAIVFPIIFIILYTVQRKYLIY